MHTGAAVRSCPLAFCLVLWAVAVSLGVACGRTPLAVRDAADSGSVAAELCNGLDDDGNGRVDEGFRDDLGRYMDAAHCGRCDRNCDAEPIERATQQGCTLVADVPECVATRARRATRHHRMGAV
jgi:hypothetical protein